MPNEHHPRPFNPVIDMDFKGDQSLWYARPQPIFSVTVCPTGQHDRLELHEILDLVYFTNQSNTEFSHAVKQHANAV